MAIALWLPPGVESDGETVMRLMRESMSDKTFEDINGVFEQMDALHPTVDHWYLPLTDAPLVPSLLSAGPSLRSHPVLRLGRIPGVGRGWPNPYFSRSDRVWVCGFANRAFGW